VPPPAAPPLVMNQKRNTYVPHVLPLVAGATVQFRSEDPELHNVYAWELARNRTLFNVAIVPRVPTQFQRAFSDTGVVRLTCNIHKEMLAFIIVLQNPHFVLVEKAATAFRLEGVPPGKHVLRVWGEKLDEATLARTYPVEVAGRRTTRLSITQGGDKR